jgi:Uma2 family endonuclease
MSIVTPPIPPTLEEGPAWEIARLFPHQGHWDEGDYLTLNQMTNHFVEMVDGRVEVLEMPGKEHQKRARRFADALDAFCAREGVVGETVLAPYPVRVSRLRFREPDVVFAFDSRRLGNDFGEKPDLVVEVVSQDRERDLVKKRRDYAAAQIPEYWIVDPQEKRVLVLALKNGKYTTHGEYGQKDRAESKIVKGFEIDAAQLLA